MIMRTSWFGGRVCVKDNSPFVCMIETQDGDVAHLLYFVCTWAETGVSHLSPDVSHFVWVTNSEVDVSPAWRESIPDEMMRERVKRSCLQTLTTSKRYSDILSDGNWRNNTFFQHKCSYNRNKNGLLFNTLHFWKRFCSVNRYHINTFILTN